MNYEKLKTFTWELVMSKTTQVESQYQRKNYNSQSQLNRIFDDHMCSFMNYFLSTSVSSLLVFPSVL